MTPDAKPQYYIEMPDRIEANAYTVEVAIERFGQITYYEYACEFDRSMPQAVKDDAIMAVIGDVLEKSMRHRQILDCMVFLGEEFLNGEEGYNDDDG